MTCPHCREPRDGTHRFCTTCGGKLEGEAPVAHSEEPRDERNPWLVGAVAAAGAALLTLAVGLGLNAVLGERPRAEAATGPVVPGALLPAGTVPPSTPPPSVPHTQAAGTPPGHLTLPTPPGAARPAFAPVRSQNQGPISTWASRPAPTPGFVRAPGPLPSATGEPAMRHGLPEVNLQRPQPAAPNRAGLPPAVVGEVIPLPIPERAPAASPNPTRPAGEASGEKSPEKPAARRELLEPEGGFIRIEPLERPRNEREEARPANGARNQETGITVRLGDARTGEAALEQAKGTQQRAYRAWQQGNVDEAGRLYAEAAKAFEAAAAAGADGDIARRGAEACRRAVAALR